MLVTKIPFPTMFSFLTETNIKFLVTFYLSYADAFNLDKSKSLSFGKDSLSGTLYRQQKYVL